MESLPSSTAHGARPRAGLWLALGATVLLAACGSLPVPNPVAPPDVAATPKPARPTPREPVHATGPISAPPTPPLRTSPYPGPDGPEPNPPPNLHRVPDAVPRVETLRSGSPNLPYTIKGQQYVPIAADVPVREIGVASWYGRKFHGRRTANGEIYNMYAMTAAHPTLPIPSFARVRNRANGRSVVVRVNDRGPFKAGRVIDLSYTAALKLGFVKKKGTAPVEVERLTHAAIRTGSWRTAGPALADAASSSGWWLQIGEAMSSESALKRQRELAGRAPTLAPLLTVRAEENGALLQAGPFSSRAQALTAGERLNARTSAPQPLRLVCGSAERLATCPAESIAQAETAR